MNILRIDGDNHWQRILYLALEVKDVTVQNLQIMVKDGVTLVSSDSRALIEHLASGIPGSIPWYK